MDCIIESLTTISAHIVLQKVPVDILILLKQIFIVNDFNLRKWSKSLVGAAGIVTNTVSSPIICRISIWTRQYICITLCNSANQHKRFILAMWFTIVLKTDSRP